MDYWSHFMPYLMKIEIGDNLTSIIVAIIIVGTVLIIIKIIWGSIF